MKKKYIMIFIITIILAVCSGCSSSSDEGDEIMEERRSACEAKSSTFYKCSYSLWEGRCVCKQR